MVSNGDLENEGRYKMERKGGTRLLCRAKKIVMHTTFNCP
jgi:hypothetical protein